MAHIEKECVWRYFNLSTIGHVDRVDPYGKLTTVVSGQVARILCTGLMCDDKQLVFLLCLHFGDLSVCNLAKDGNIYCVSQ